MNPGPVLHSMYVTLVPILTHNVKDDYVSKYNFGYRTGLLRDQL